MASMEPTAAISGQPGVSCILHDFRGLVRFGKGAEVIGNDVDRNPGLMILRIEEIRDELGKVRGVGKGRPHELHIGSDLPEDATLAS